MLAMTLICLPMLADPGVEVAVCGAVETPGLYLLQEGATTETALRAAFAAEGEAASLVREGRFTPTLPAGQPLLDGDIVLVAPAFQGTTRELAILAPGQPPVMAQLTMAEANLTPLRALFGLTATDPALVVAPQPLSDGSLADGSAVIVPAACLQSPAYRRVLASSVRIDARDVAPLPATAPRPGTGSQPVPVQTVALPTVLPRTMPSTMPAPLPSEPAMTAAGPMQAASVTVPRGGEADSGRPLSNLAQFPIHLNIAHPDLSVGVYPAAAAADMQPFDAGRHWGEGGGQRATPLRPVPQSQPSAASPMPRSNIADSLVRTASAVGTGRALVDPVVGSPAGTPQTLNSINATSIDARSIAARPLPSEATPAVQPPPAEPAAEPPAPIDTLAEASKPSASRLGGVMFAAIVLVVVCGGLVLWSRDGQEAEHLQAAETRADIDELPAVAAPIVERPATTIPPASLHGPIVGLEKLRIDAAHPIAPPHYASRPTTSQTGQPAMAGSMAGPKAGSRQTGRRAPVAVGGGSEGGDAPADLLARALQAMQREKRDA